MSKSNTAQTQTAPAPMTWDPIAAQNEARAAEFSKLQARAEMQAIAQVERDAAKAANPKKVARAKLLEPRTTPCLCGCGNIPAGRKSNWMPGHDAIWLSAQKKRLVAQLKGVTISCDESALVGETDEG